jgi:hypothetical protein
MLDGTATGISTVTPGGKEPVDRVIDNQKKQWDDWIGRSSIGLSLEREEPRAKPRPFTVQARPCAGWKRGIPAKKNLMRSRPLVSTDCIVS